MGSDDPGAGLAREVSSWDPPQRADFFATADREEVLATVGCSLQLEGAQHLLGEGGSAALQQRLALRRRLRRESEHVAGLFEDASLRHLFVKGFAFERLHPGAFVRQFDDLDVAVDSAETFWACGRLLEERGYALELMTAEIGSTPPAASGVANFARRCDSREPALEVEIHFAALPAHWYTSLRYPAEFWAGAEPIEPGSRVRAPGGRWSALGFLAETIDRPALRVRDQLDGARLLRRLDAAGREWLAGQASDLGLRGEHRLLVGLDSRAAPSSGTLYRTARRAAPATVRALTHTLPHARASRGRRESVGLAARGLARDVVASAQGWPWVERALEPLSERPSGATRPSRQGYAPLFPVDPQRRGALSLRAVGDELVLTTPLGTFVPAPLPLMSERRLARVLAGVQSLDAAADAGQPGPPAP